MEQTVSEIKAKPGDLIEIFRGKYEHWAVYIGGDEVVHLVPDAGDSGGPLNYVLFLDSDTAVVRHQPLWEVVGSDRFRINNLLDDEYEPRERHVIVRQALRLVGRRLPYGVFTKNCEHFVTELRYGEASSRQVKNAAVIAGAATAGVVIAALLGAALFSSLNTDDNKNRES